MKYNIIKKWIQLWFWHDTFERFNGWKCIPVIPGKHTLFHVQQIWTTPNVQHVSHFLTLSAPYPTTLIFSIIVHLSLDFNNKFQIVIFVGKFLAWNWRPQSVSERQMNFSDNHLRCRSFLLMSVTLSENGANAGERS